MAKENNGGCVVFHFWTHLTLWLYIVVDCFGLQIVLIALRDWRLFTVNQFKSISLYLHTTMKHVIKYLLHMLCSESEIFVCLSMLTASEKI